jgi:hypothetical protein
MSILKFYISFLLLSILIKPKPIANHSCTLTNIAVVDVDRLNDLVWEQAV